MEYSQRLVCFIDLLGFESAIQQSNDEPEIRDFIHRTIHALSPEEIRNVLYADIPLVENDVKTTFAGKYSENIPKGILNALHNDIPIEITQFSDSFVISCPADNPVSCYFLLQTIFTINLMYFYNLGMIMRGGLTIGALIHEENGALFGPAMIDAYKLESKKAIYPRVLVSKEAHKHLTAVFKSVDSVETLKFPVSVVNKSFDGHLFFDLISIFEFTKLDINEKEKLSEQLSKIEKDILCSSPDSYSKIAYLLNRWESHISL